MSLPVDAVRRPAPVGVGAYPGACANGYGWTAGRGCLPCPPGWESVAEGDYVICKPAPPESHGCPYGTVYDRGTGSCVPPSYLVTGRSQPGLNGVGVGAAGSISPTCPTGSVAVGSTCQNLANPGTTVPGTCPTGYTYNPTTTMCDPTTTSTTTYVEFGLLALGVVAVAVVVDHSLKKGRR